MVSAPHAAPCRPPDKPARLWPDCPEHLRHLLFRDWLREHQDDRDRYAEVKELAMLVAQDVAEYNREKSDFIRSLYRTIFEYHGLV